MEIYVNKYHIQRGEKCNPQYCPIALALKKYFPGDVVNVGRNIIKVFNPEKGERHWIIKPEIRRLIDQFDNCQKIEPFKFRMTLRK